MIAVEAPIGVDPFFCERLEVSKFFRLHLDDIDVQIISLCVDCHGCRETHDHDQGPKGSLPHDCLLLSDICGEGIVGKLHPRKCRVKALDENDMHKQ
ncbi:MAG: hypothetical protein DMG49_16770 [Acidobacteria bacterium]|nr:MAG: hypothetical protein DMG49_16770 [Acidobacteriota bacterium]